jgi:thiol-disulfide isomerase/thioredoxin
MSLRRLFFYGLTLAVAILPLTVSAANLSERLLSNNFNLYSAPFPAGNMLLQDFKGRPVNLSSLKGKVVILNFWKIDCAPCSVEKPILERVYRKYSARGLDIVSVNLFDDHEKLRSYVSKTGFSFTLAYDPAGRLSIRSQKSARGAKTNFIVNDRSEAIYEVPGVPTTYLIDRNGKVLGSSAGLINWEEEPFDELLDSALGGWSRSTEADNGFNTAAKQSRGPVANPSASKVIPPAAQENPKEEPPVFVQPKETSPKQTMKKQTGAPVEKPAKPARTKPAPVVKKKPEVTPEETADLRKPRPFVPTGAAKPVAGRNAQTKKGAVPGQGTATGNLQSGAVPGLPALPAAQPYTPPGQRPAAPPLAFDDSGNVMARIPDNNRQPRNLLHPAGSNAPQEQGQSRGSKSSIEGSIMDSFGRPTQGQSEAATPVVAPQGAATKPAAGAMDQVSRDFRNLGSGIKETFSRFFPGKQQ